LAKFLRQKLKMPLATAAIHNDHLDSYLFFKLNNKFESALLYSLRDKVFDRIHIDLKRPEGFGRGFNFLIS